MEEQEKFNKTFRGFSFFVFRYSAKNENAELDESFLIYRITYNLNLINIKKKRVVKVTKLRMAAFYCGKSLFSFGKPTFYSLFHAQKRLNVMNIFKDSSVMYANISIKRVSPAF